ncbi:MAG: rRNA maturation RNase YbeY [Gaiellales bacterium]
MTIQVEVANRSGWTVDEDAAAGVLRSALSAEGVTDGELGLTLVDEAEMADMNAGHRGVAGPTDVLSFPLDGGDPLPDGLPRQLGDLVVCPQVAERDGTPLEVLLVHGALHLLGYDHETDDGRMLARQDTLTEEVERVASSPA